MNSIQVIVLFIASVLLTKPLVLLAANRSKHQPLPYHLDEERNILATVLKNPASIELIADLQADHFVDPTYGRLWSIMHKYVNTSKSTHTVHVHPKFPDDDIDLHDSSPLLDIFDVPDIALASALLSYDSLNSNDLVHQAELVYNSGLSRDQYVGRLSIEQTGDPLLPLHYEVLPATKFSIFTTFMMLFIGFRVSHITANSLYEGSAATLMTLSLSVLVIGSVIWTLVDIDTLYIDVASLYVIGGLAWILAVAGSYVNHTLNTQLLGVGAAMVVVLFIGVISRFYTSIRSQTGMGGGDYKIMLITIGVPVAVTGNFVLGNQILMFSLFSGIVGWLIKRCTQPGFTKDSPYAFGPYLAGGWIIALAVWRLFS
jgi:prepilin signal peptidase PulO-like enzyme (type II secretory pathway)